MGEELKLYEVYVERESALGLDISVQYYDAGTTRKEVFKRVKQRYASEVVENQSAIKVKEVTLEGFRITLTPLEQKVSSQ